MAGRASPSTCSGNPGGTVGFRNGRGPFTATSVGYRRRSTSPPRNARGRSHARAPMCCLIPRTTSPGADSPTLVECVLRHGTGVRWMLDDLLAVTASTSRPAVLRDGARAVVSVPRNFEDRFVNLCHVREQTAVKIGTTQGTGEDAPGDPGRVRCQRRGASPPARACCRGCSTGQCRNVRGLGTTARSGRGLP